MLVVETIAKIRRAHFVDGRPIKAICRELGVSRKVVRKVIRSQATEFRYERETQPLPKMGPWSSELARLLAANESKAARERLTLIRLFEELRGLGYAGGYDAVRRYARRWSRERGASTASAYVPLSFAPGEAYQFDWSHEVVLLSGTTVMVKVAHVRLCHSRMLFVRAYPRETQEMVFDAHDRAFALFNSHQRFFSRGLFIFFWKLVDIFAKRADARGHGHFAKRGSFRGLPHSSSAKPASRFKRGCVCEAKFELCVSCSNHDVVNSSSLTMSRGIAQPQAARKAERAFRDSIAPDGRIRTSSFSSKSRTVRIGLRQGCAHWLGASWFTAGTQGARHDRAMRSFA